MIIRPINFQDCYKVAKVHMLAFPGFFLSELGEPFLKCFYSAVILDSAGVGLLVTDIDGVVSGFVVGTLHSNGFYKKIIKKNWFTLIWSAMPKLLLRPRRILKIFRSLKSSANTELPNTACLLSICVNPNVAGKGIGKVLLSAFEEQLLNCGKDYVFLTTDANNNDSVNQFYLRNDFTLRSSFEQRAGRVMNVYVKELR